MNHGIRYLLRKAKYHFLPSTQAKRMQPWIKVDGDKTLRQEYELTPESVVFDLGGYEGNWTSDIFSRYLCTIHVFEPVPYYAEKIKKRFAMNKQITVHNYGLGNDNFKMNLSVSGDSSSSFNKKSELAIEIELKNFLEVVENISVERVDLMKINIEGGEFDLLEFILDTPFISKIKNLQIQFHDFVPNAKERMDQIKTRLSDTHEATYAYEFVWENWKLKI